MGDGVIDFLNFIDRTGALLLLTLRGFLIALPVQVPVFQYTCTGTLFAKIAGLHSTPVPGTQVLLRFRKIE
jgi:hypothetical protein